MSVLQNLNQLIFPARCISCAIFYQDLRDDFNICQKCFEAIIKKGRVSKRGSLNIYAGTEYDRLTSNLILSAKESNHHSARKFLAFLLTNSLKNAISRNLNIETQFDNKIYLIPIPSRASANRSRGYSHINLLLIELINSSRIELKPFDVSILNLLQHTRKIRDKSSLNFREREANMMNAFRLKDSQESGNLDSKALLFLVDDLVASGSTILAANSLLSQRGFRVAGVVAACASLRFTY